MLIRSLILVITLLFCQIVTAQITIRDAQGLHTFNNTPQRVVTLSWTIAEQLIELEAPLIAVADTAGYKEWVANPAIPADVEDLGARAEPNLEKMSRLKPDLIIVANITQAQQNRLQAIAPVLNFSTFNKDHDNPQEAIKNFRDLAALFGKEKIAERKLTDMQHQFGQLKTKLLRAFNDKLPEVTTVRFANTSSAYIYGDNSMSQYALEQLGIKPAIPIPRTQWGLVQKRVLELSKIQEGALLYFEPFAQWKQLQESRLWQAMPVVRKKQVAAITSTWTYGGAMSLKYLAQAMSDSLLKIAANKSQNTNTTKANKESLE